jgi:hypothetical protein
MNRPEAEVTTNEQRRDVISGSRWRALAGGGHDCWTFVYGFFSNGTPFDAPNRSEPCPRPS